MDRVQGINKSIKYESGVFKRWNPSTINAVRVPSSLPQVQTSEVASARSPGIRIERIAICMVGELFGGVERHVVAMLSGLLKQDVQVLLVLFHDGELASRSRALGVDPVILPARNLAVLSTARRLALILEQQRIRIVHAHGYKASVFCALARRGCRFALVKTVHGLPEPMRSAMRGWRDRLYHLADSIATRVTRATICYVTEDLRTYYRQTHSGLRAMVIPNGVGSMDREQFPRPSDMHEDWFNLVIVGRLEWVKGHHLAIDAVAADGVSPDVHLHILGAGPREQELQVLAKRNGITQRVHVLGFRRNIYDYIAHCDVLLMPSLHEGLPYTLLEAMALGVPVIASRVGGLAEVMQDETTGLLIPPGDVKALAQAIARLRRDAKLRCQLGLNAQRLQRNHYSLEVMTARYLAVYQNLLSLAE